MGHLVNIGWRRLGQQGNGAAWQHGVGHGGGGRVRGIDELEKMTGGQGHAVSRRVEKGGGGVRAGLWLGPLDGPLRKNQKKSWAVGAEKQPDGVAGLARREGWGRAGPMR